MKILKKIVENKWNKFQSVCVGETFRCTERPTSDIYVRISLPIDIDQYKYNALNLETCELHSFRWDQIVNLCNLEITEI